MIIHNNFEKKNKILYGIGKDNLKHLDISDGTLDLSLPGGGKKISFQKIITFLNNNNLSSTVIRVPQLIGYQLDKLYSAFDNAIIANNYPADYKGVFPVKVNHKSYTLDKIVKYGTKYNHGWEIGTKAELLIVISFLKNKNTLIICNGTKDVDYVEAVLNLRNNGYQAILSFESERELKIIIQLSKKLNINRKQEYIKCRQ